MISISLTMSSVGIYCETPVWIVSDCPQKHELESLDTDESMALTNVPEPMARICSLGIHGKVVPLHYNAHIMSNSEKQKAAATTANPPWMATRMVMF
jgi:hypothetical protein